jgi:predicted transcriptional regulator
MAAGDVALDNKLRRMIFNHITTYPGVSFNNLKNIFELSDGGLRYHLDYLEKNNKINANLDNGNRCYYPNQYATNAPVATTELMDLHKLTPIQDLILNTIKLYPGLTQKELIRQTRLNRFQVAKNLNKLSDLKLVRKYQNSRNVCYEYIPDSELKYKMLKKLVIKLLKGEIDEKTFIECKRRLDP